MIALDASVLIGHLDGTDVHHAQADAILDREVEVPLIASPFTVAEVLVEPVRRGREAEVLALLDLLGVREEPLPGDAARRLASLRVHTRLRLPDCCVLMVAEQAGAELATFDGQLAAAARARGVTVHQE